MQRHRHRPRPEGGAGLRRNQHGRDHHQADGEGAGEGGARRMAEIGNECPRMADLAPDMEKGEQRPDQRRHRQQRLARERRHPEMGGRLAPGETETADSHRRRKQRERQVGDAARPHGRGLRLRFVAVDSGGGRHVVILVRAETSATVSHFSTRRLRLRKA
ncbi:hypothetical protein KL86PLE_130090 [uncultured Pleomorphomonas sp.]|uniref:Uncharacterized protein n=1 Tax=uncultured Pleomorphomonas sp. TaxID=442121 RepID=A0A212L966_9HYPH|nr:hypothetical protein KL86PLE_130090 [uncultured Pleomorphomonas sp.]